jgi:hypothetical protein
MVQRPALKSHRRESINTAGVIIALLLFGLVSLALVTLSVKNKPASASAPAPVAVTKPAAPDKVAAVTKRKPVEPKKKPAQKTEDESDKRKPVEKKTAVAVATVTTISEKPTPSAKETLRRIERRSVSVSPRETTVTVVKAEPITPPTHIVTADELNNMEDAKQHGVEKVDSKSLGGKAIPWYSVRVGYTDSKTRADILRDVLAQQGFIKAQTQAAGDGNYYVSLGDYMFRYQAEDIADNIKKKTSMEPEIFEKTVAK